MMEDPSDGFSEVAPSTDANRGSKFGLERGREGSRPSSDDGEVPKGISGLTEVDIENLPKSEVVSISIGTPEKRGDGISSYVAYTIKTVRADDSENTTVERRFNDFVWLREALRKARKGIIIPPLPQKGLKS